MLTEEDGSRADQFVGLHPIRNASTVSRKLRGRFYNDDAIRAAVPNRYADFHVASEWMVEEDGGGMTSAVTGVVGSSAQGLVLPMAKRRRDDQVVARHRLAYVRVSDEGFGEPLAMMDELLGTALSDFSTIARATFPSVLD